MSSAPHSQVLALGLFPPISWPLSGLQARAVGVGVDTAIYGSAAGIPHEGRGPWSGPGTSSAEALGDSPR